MTVTPEFLALQAAVAGRYSIDREIGRGGMGVVFLARDVALDRLVAIKLLPPLLAQQPGLRTRFLREARTAAGLSHPHIVPIHAVEEHGDLAFFVMAFIDGETLGQRVRRAGPLAVGEAMRVIQEAAWGLSHAHARGVIHRDVKPDNILLERGSGRALVTDFGIARVQGTSDTPQPGIQGTPHYMAPEQAAGGDADARSDLYALGITAWFAVTGRRPFEASTVAGLLAKHATQVAPDIRTAAPHVPARFAAAIQRVMEKDPASRLASADALAEAIRDARGAAADVPAPVRAFLRDAESAGGEMGVSLAIGAGALGVFATFFRDDMFAGMVFYPVSAVMVGLAGARFGQVVAKARDLVRQGYDHRHVRPAVAIESRRRAEEVAVAPAARRSIARETVIVGLVGAVKTALCVWLTGVDGPVWLNFLGAAGAVMIPALAVRRIWHTIRRGKDGLWSRWLGEGLGRFVFRVAGLGLSRETSPAPGEATEIVLAARLDELYQALPADVRDRFPDFPALVAGLEADAQTMRAQADRDGERRRSEAIAALETLRLDLLRLHAGSAPVGDLTRDLEQVRKIGRDISILVERPET